jgi:hypothetical protein
MLSRLRSDVYLRVRPRIDRKERVVGVERPESLNKTVKQSLVGRC